ncbi:hypothetical protein AVEN_79234-1 [Araneus ventricosus]|uniref:Uncharacterized protein n=1 Tax=Araneus ventricosus TaxID=182803 RepID=A0A4Y2KAK1_ARAVE|nr:hypothetical protein AVEN_79234-1 [Araneus ventricosus]
MPWTELPFVEKEITFDKESIFGIDSTSPLSGAYKRYGSQSMVAYELRRRFLCAKELGLIGEIEFQEHRWAFSKASRLGKIEL